ncbi:CsgG/HfaB family protein [Hydrogenimonas urashimensis]|uniref:CsgG/HfaB family protein n=1 Tax=Hydrogenimonas urashimensis TaxID=2740515 RepID=UPI001914E8B4|nr:CsgG/HfaB family protein [Hydrogenimonas urashimensis]
MKLVALALVFLVFTGCSKTVRIASLQPAEIDRAAGAKRIAVYTFRHDTVGLTEKIETKAAAARVDGKPWFTVISRGDLSKILEELRLQESGLADEEQVVEAGKLLGATALITGSVTAADAEDSYYTEKRFECLDKKCKEYNIFDVSCMERSAVVSAHIRLVDIAKGEVLFADTLKRSRHWNRCFDSSTHIPTKGEALDLLANEIADHFIQRLTPHYTYHEVELLEEPDIDYSAEEKKLLKNALTFIEHGRYDKAEQLLGELLRSTGEQSYVAAYDLGVVKETKGELEAARSLYLLADRNCPEPNETIDAAIVRIQQSIRAKESALKQMNQ